MVDERTSPDVIGMKSLREVLESQLQAALETLRESIELCPDKVWSSREHVNTFWQVAYHTLSKLEHQIVNIRHVQHHAAQLADRLRFSSDIGIRWVDAGPVERSTVTGQTGTGSG